MFLGVVAVAAAVKTALPHPTATATESQAWLLSGGAAAFLAGDLCFRATLDMGRSVWRLAAIPVVLITALAGLTVSITAELAALAVVLIVAIAADSMEESRLRRGAEAA
jgi:low temperature requirement protein LtrA